MERDMIALWEREGTFETSLEQRDGAPRWTFYEGPPTANGTPGVHHVEARVFKDVFPRFRTMQGYLVERKGGWDCHGLPVEIAVEKELGFNGKPDIEAFGVAEFNAKCREAVLRNVGLFEQMTERMGYWVDTDNPYRTMDTPYVESVWWALQQIFDKGLLAEDYRVAPYCPRCGTGLSDHEVAQGYESVVDPSVYVRFPLTSGPLAGEASLLVWTTTPWTLVSNALVAAKADITYVAVSNGHETLVVAEPLVETALGEGWTVDARFEGAELEGWTYARPFDLVDWPDDNAHYVVTEDYVTTDDGSGLVHQAPAFGADDFASGKRNGVAMVNPIDPTGHFEDGLDLVGGAFFKKADAILVEDLERRGLLFRHLPYEHSYPHCWRCRNPLIYKAVSSWFVEVTKIKDRMVELNQQINWIPENVKDGQFGKWLENARDWSISRNRYWGSPIPVWVSDDPNYPRTDVYGSLEELK
ncbi:class I tRNA ligase family protein, partial [Mumia sp.]|uniref:class I tRNA ligase family protein n=1 Tax=Mumia sp. TaxID=1965300 RepID=UPI002635A071